jgi:PAS domain S-box-containing protein
MDTAKKYSTSKEVFSESSMESKERNISRVNEDESAVQKRKDIYETFISRTREGVCRYELKDPISIHDSKEKQIRTIYQKAVVVECNDAMAKMYGYKKAHELVGKSLENVIVPTEKNNELFSAFIDLNYRLSEVETTYSVGENTTYFLHDVMGILQNEKLAGLWIMQRDITSQKLIEVTLAKTRNQLNFALAAGSVGTYVWNFKTNKITWTKVQESLYGLKEYSFKGTLEDWLSFIHPRDAEPTRKAIEKSIRERKELSVEFRIFWPDGSLHWILSRANTNFDKNGAPIEMSGVNIDISERKFKEQLILENEERFKVLVQNSFDVITVFNYDGTITYQSESIERVLGYPAKERLGENLFEKSIVHPDDREAEKIMFEKCLEEPSKYIQGELRMLHIDGSYRIMEVGCINLVNNSSIHGIIKNYRDITKRREIEKQKEEFIGVASHELKTPVTSIKAYAQILHDSLMEKEDHVSADLLLRMDHQIDRLTTLISDLLDVTKITEGQLVLKYEEYDLTELINEVVSDLQMTTKKHQIIKELQPLKMVNGDKERTAQVIVNLLSNAIKYSPAGDKIIVKTSSTEDEVTVSIRDFGIGISKEMQKKLFKRFFRVTDETTSTFPGLGLGLFIATEIVRKQHGRIWVESAPKEGSTFCFTLPYHFIKK